MALPGVFLAERQELVPRTLSGFCFLSNKVTDLPDVTAGRSKADSPRAGHDVMHHPCPCTHMDRDSDHGTSGHSVPALPSPELEFHPASPLPSLIIPVTLSLFSPFL